ncbi:DEAD/DEAH box helicase [Rarobacter incanus]|uniref:ATP-dependent Lhr-like helicase n=1 Tax=Rarobacter incanus TaxID=153494 RepID=A0A542SQV5_9MICO|nr:DEAD/DEAH box helicase [Rarobacter incanus]TQK76587.1 ATP-dependent Lhr-like helicase [Rarobacter incanus]
MTFSRATQAWLDASFDAPTPAQRDAWQAIGQGNHTLVVAPTGSGKTLAAFLWAIDQHLQVAHPASPGVSGPAPQILYVSPLKALASDVERNLRAPLTGISQRAHRLGISMPPVSVGVRTGDTSQRDRQRMTKDPPDIVITTPESLYLMLTSSASAALERVGTIIIDEIHAIAGTKRGAHLAVSLERLDALLPQPAQRVGLSATVTPADRVADFLAGRRAPDAGGRAVRIVQPPSTKVIDLGIQFDLPTVGEGGMEDERASSSIWPQVEGRIVDLIEQNRSTLVFVNSRRTAEKLTARLNEEWARRHGATNALGDGVLADTSKWPAEITAQAGAALGIEPVIARAHHGSMSRAERTSIEDALKAGRLPAVVATSSLELGIDMGAIDLVIQVGAPPSVAAGLQRVGRAGHQVGQVSRGVMLPLYPGELVAAVVSAQGMRDGDIEPVRELTNPLDVLAQQIIAAVAVADWHEQDLLALVRRAAPFATLGDATWAAVLDMLAGRYPSQDFADLRPRIAWDRATGMLKGRPGAALMAVTSGGTIPDRGLYPVVLAGSDGSKASNRVGELDEEMVFESRVGDAITLGSSTWRIAEITPQQVIVTPAPGQPGRLPFWKGDGPGRPFQLGAAMGAFTRQFDARRRSDGAAAHAQLLALGLNAGAANALIDLLREQYAATGRVPDDKCLVIERFTDELGDWRIVVHSPFGARVHAPWALVLSGRIREMYGLDASVSYTDDGLVLRMPPSGDSLDAGMPAADLVIDPADVLAAIQAEITGSAMFATRFREASARALLLAKRKPGLRQPLWQQRHRAAQLLAVAAQFPDFPIVIEAVRECLQDDFDVPSLLALMTAIDSGRIRIVEVTTSAPSPYARSLLMSYTAQFMYDSDAPLAERRAVALSLDPVLLAEILGSHAAPDLADLLDADAIAQVSADVEWTSADRRVARVDHLWELLRTHGPLTMAQIMARATLSGPDVRDWLADNELRQVIRVARPHGGEWWAAAEDAGRLRDALGVPPPAGVPSAFLEPAADPLGDLVRRFARTHGPFTAAELAADLCLSSGMATEVIRRLTSAGHLVAGPTRSLRGDPTGGPAGPTGADARASTGVLPPPASGTATVVDADVLRRIRRRSLASLRGQVEAVSPNALARFVPAWQRLGHTAWRRGDEGQLSPERVRPDLQGVDGLLTAIEQLAGARFPASALESWILPSRVSDYRPEFLDELSARGEILWCGHQSLPGARGDGVISLHLAETAALTLPPHGNDARPTPDTAAAPTPDTTAAPTRPTPDTAAAPTAPTPDTTAAAPPNPTSPPVPTSPDLAAVLLTTLRTGGQFFDHLLTATRAPADAVAAALWELAWRGLITSDSFGSLRHMVGARGGAHRAKRSPGRARPGRGLRGLRALAHSLQAPTSLDPRPPTDETHFAPTMRADGKHALRDIAAARAGGRWSTLCADSETGAAAPPDAASTDATLRAHADVTVLLQRYGVVPRTPGLADQIVTPAATMYRVLSDMEAQGHVRRGYFVEGLGGAQFALPGVVDELRTFSAEPSSPQTTVLAATDPANPYGIMLDWPPAADDKHRPGRRAGAVVVLVDGRLALYLERGGRTLLAFSNNASEFDEAIGRDPRSERPGDLEVAANALLAAVRSGIVSRATVRTINATPALESVSRARSHHPNNEDAATEVVNYLLSAGAAVSAQGLLLEAPHARR